MYRILFVDDDPYILKGLSRMLRRARDDWEPTYATSATEALEIMRTASFHVVVADMYMAGTDGVALLAKVQTEFPKTVRIMMSAATDPKVALRAAPVAHQFLSRPCSVETLKSVVDQVLATQDTVEHDAIKLIIGQVGMIPSVPDVYAQLVEVMNDENRTVERVVDVIAQDAGVTIKVLHMVNTAFFGQPQATTSLTHAVNLLGLTLLQNIVLAAGVFQAFRFDEARFPGLRPSAVLQHSTAVARLASTLDPKAPWRDDAFTGGLLHDFGKLLLAARIGDDYANVLREAAETGRPEHHVERDLLGYTHADVAAYLMGLWRLPQGVTDAVAHHHSEMTVEGGVLTAPAAVYVANLLVHLWSAGPDARSEIGSLIDGLGFGANADDWVTRVEETCQESKVGSA